MPTQPPFVNDESENSPRLVVYGNDWGLSELPQWPHEAPWSYGQTLEKLVEAGFDGVQSEPKRAKLIRQKGLRFAMSGRANTPAEVGVIARLAVDNEADGLTLHAGWGMETNAEMDALADAVLDAAAKYKLPIFIETHRATMTQDLFRTLQLVKRFPDIRFNGDFSHYYCSHEFLYLGFEKNLEYMQPILKRIGFFHGRISDAECMQVDIGDGRDNIHAQHFKTMWREAMQYWLSFAKPGDILPFTPELGPPSSRYAITVKNPQGQMCELSDRWQQSLVLKRLAEEAFAEARGAYS